MPGYNVYRNDRAHGRGGGVLLYVKSSLKCRQIKWPKNIQLECIGVEIALSPAMTFTVICIYRKPTTKPDFYDKFKSLLNNCNSNNEIFIVGDFNINWNDKKARKNLKQITEHFNFNQLIEQPTRITSHSKTLIDLLFVNKPERIFKTFNYVTGLSDHNAIFFSRKLTKKRFNDSYRLNAKISPKNIIPKKSLPNFEAALQSIDWTEIIQSNDIENCSCLFHEKVNEVILNFTKRVSHNKKRNPLPWVNDECKKWMKERDQQLKKYMKSRLITDRHKFTSLRNKVTQIMRKVKAAFFIHIISEANGNSKKIWQNLNQLIGRDRKAKQEIELKSNNIVESNPDLLTNEFNDYFINSVREISELFPPPDHKIRPIDLTQPVFNLREISSLEVSKIIGSLKNSKAKDIHGLDTHLLKICKESLIAPITHMVNLSLQQRVVPSSWKLATVTPIFKSGDRSNISNYRPISILPVVSKIVERWVANIINDHLHNSPSNLHAMQFGFRANHSTESANHFFIENVKSKLDTHPCVGAVFLDLKKAFDTVNHGILLTKLTDFNFSPEAIQWIKSYLASRKQCVQIDSTKSSVRDVSVGVPQGSILGPLLFSLYINDLPKTCKDVNFQMYADDAVIYTHARSVKEAASTLTSAMEQVNDWLFKSCLLLNSKKKRSV